MQIIFCHLATSFFVISGAVLLLWISAAIYAALHPNRGRHNRLAHTWVVRHKVTSEK